MRSPSRRRAHHSDTDSARRADAACGTYRTGRNAGHHAGLSAVCSTSEARNVSASHAGHGLRPAPVRRCCLAGTGSAGRTGDAIRPDSGHDAATPYVGRSDHIRFTGCQELPVVREYSAGGLIFDDQNRVAIIARHSRSGHLEWCLPKGHIEKGETPQQTAVREVHEETGILGEVIDSIATIDYWFTGTTQRVHKLVHHFALKQTGGELTVEGDPDHEAEDAIWVRFEDLDDVLSYPNERKIAWLYARKKNRQANE